MTKWYEQPAVVAAAVAGAVSLVSSGAGYLTRRSSEREERRRQSYAKAFEAYVAYREFPFVVRRRAAEEPAAERRRISDAMHDVQVDLGYYRAWIHTESRHCGLAFDALVQALKQADGKLIHEGWLQPAVTSDEQMNIDIRPQSLGELEDVFLHEVRIHLAWRPRWMHWSSKSKLKQQRELIATMRTPPGHAEEPPSPGDAAQGS